MKATPFQVYLRSLIVGRVRPGLVSREEALDRLRQISGEDFGDDVERWREWGRRHRERSGMWPDDDA